MRKEEFFQSGKAKRTSKARSRSNRSEEGAKPKERHKRKASDVQVASFVSAERSFCCWCQTPPLRSRCHHLLQPMLPIWLPQNPSSIDWPMGEYKSDENSTSGPRSTMASSSRFDPSEELPLQPCQTWIWIQLDLSPCSSLVVLCHPSLQRILSNTCAFGFWSKRVLFSKEAYWNEKELQSSRQANSQWWRNCLC